jgi:hypothetical protein
MAVLHPPTSQSHGYTLPAEHGNQYVAVLVPYGIFFKYPHSPVEFVFHPNHRHSSPVAQNGSQPIPLAPLCRRHFICIFRY